MKFGLCIVLDYPRQGNSEAGGMKEWMARLQAKLEEAAGYGLDRVELPLSPFAALAEPEFEEAVSLVKASGLSCPVVNSMIRPGLPLTGPEVNPELTEAYLESALLRAARLGAGTVILGAGQARNIPQGFDKETAAEQFEAFLHQCEAHAAKHELIVAIEPLNRKECNWIKWVEEAIELAAGLYLPHIRVAADSYHMLMQREEYDILEEAVEMGLLAHVHLADRDRRLPGCPLVEKGADFKQLLGTLKRSGYAGEASLECAPEQNSSLTIPQSLEYLNKLWDEL